MKIWLKTLNHELWGSTLTLSRSAGKCFFLLSGEVKNVLHNAFMLSPFISEWGTCLLQIWVPGFNPNNPNNLAFPTWVALRNKLYEQQAIAITQTLGEVIGTDMANESAKVSRFCVNLKINKGWVTNINLETKGGILSLQEVVVDYDKLLIRCRVCHSWKHMVKDCNEIRNKPMRDKRPYRPPLQQHIHQQEKWKSIVMDHEGFQQVIRKKNIRRNIFDKVDDSLRQRAFKHRKEAWATKRHIHHGYVSHSTERTEILDANQGRIQRESVVTGIEKAR